MKDLQIKNQEGTHITIQGMYVNTLVHWNWVKQCEYLEESPAKTVCQLLMAGF